MANAPFVYTNAPLHCVMDLVLATIQSTYHFPLRRLECKSKWLTQYQRWMGYPAVLKNICIVTCSICFVLYKPMFGVLKRCPWVITEYREFVVTLLVLAAIFFFQCFDSTLSFFRCTTFTDDTSISYIVFPTNESEIEPSTRPDSYSIGSFFFSFHKLGLLI